MKALIWDMDGVLIHSQKLYYKSDCEFFEEMGIQFTDADVAGLLGVNTNQGARGILERHPELSLSLEEVEERYRASLLNALRREENLCLIDGVYDWILKLNQLGYKMAIASSSTEPMVSYVAERFGLDKIMSAVINGDMVSVSKPNPEIFLMAARAIGAEPSDCTVIEDSEFGILAANNAGMRSLAFTATNIHDSDHSEADAAFDAYNDENFNKYFSI